MTGWNSKAGSKGDTMIAVQPVRRRKLSDDIVQRLEAMMLSGTLPVGSQMPSERELMEMLEVGRPSVREAMFALQKMGLVSIRNGERAFVTHPSAKNLVQELSGSVRHMLSRPGGVREFQQARSMLECTLARNAARCATDDEIANLADALANNKAAIGNLASFTETDVAFHYQIAQISHNSIFTALHSAVLGWLSEQRSSLRSKGAERAAFQAHKDIYEAIAAHNPDAVENAMLRHMDEVANYYWLAQGRER
jgi:DNA-binding FadR family transcriptional regulator